MPRLALVGNLSHDRIAGGPLRLGGGVFHGARALALLDRPAQVVARGEALEPLPWPATILPAGETATFSIRYKGDARVMEVDAVGEPWDPADAASIGEDVEWVHIAALMRSDFSAETIAALAPGRALSLDGQGLVRVPALGPLRLDDEFDPAVLRGVSMLKVSEEEAEALGGIDVLDRLGVAEVILTRGHRGVLVLAEGEHAEVPASPVPTDDPTGAGDAFAVGYLAARSDGRGPVEAARAAAELVALFLS